MESAQDQYGRIQRELQEAAALIRLRYMKFRINRLLGKELEEEGD